MKALLKKLARKIAPVTVDEIVPLMHAEAARLKAELDVRSLDLRISAKSSWESPNVAGHVYEPETHYQVMVYNPISEVCHSGEGDRLDVALVKLQEEMRRR